MTPGDGNHPSSTTGTMESKNILTPFIKSLFLSPPNLKPSDLALVIRLIVQGKATDVQISAFLTALRLTGLDHQPEFIAAAAASMLEWSSTFTPEDVNGEFGLDIVGTGGDGQNTFNVSTSSAIVCAGLGLHVYKHGGKASTSASGAGDLLGSLQVDLSKINASNASKVMRESDFTFLFAPNFHPGMKAVAPIRSSIGIPTIFNILGPLLNPAPIRARIIGVNSESLGKVFAQAVISLDKQRYGVVGKTMIVWGRVGLDEISPVSRTKCWLVDPSDESIQEFYLEPKDFGLEEFPLASVASGTPDENANTLLKILRNEVDETDPVYNYILLNAGALLHVAGVARDWKEGAQLAAVSIQSGKALEALNKLRNVVSEL